MTSYCVTAALAVALPAHILARDKGAEDFTISANVGYISDYRFRGVSLSDEDFALQGGIDVEHESGFYVGTWGSSIESFNGSEMELDICGGYATELSGTSFDLGLLAYTFPGGDNADYYEIYTSAGRTFGSVDVTAGFAYIPQPEQRRRPGQYLYLR